MNWINDLLEPQKETIEYFHDLFYIHFKEHKLNTASIKKQLIQFARIEDYQATALIDKWIYEIIDYLEARGAK